MNKPDVVVVPNGPNSVDFPAYPGELGDVTKARIGQGARAAYEDSVRNLLFTGRAADVMARYAGKMSVHGIRTYCEGESFDTVGNAHFTKTEFLEPQGWENVHVVTSPWNLQRTRGVWQRVLGDDYQLTFEIARAENDGQYSAWMERLADVYDRTLILSTFGLARVKAEDDFRRQQRIMRRHPRSPEFIFRSLVRNQSAAA